MTTDTRVPRPNRRVFIETALAAGAAATLPISPALAKAKHTRYSVTSPMGQKMLVSYEKGVKAMLALSPTDSRNWFRNAFTHFMDCPHGNWWFYVWHRGYIGYFEETIRNLSGDANFTLPYWDWTELPRIPDAMFDGALTPTDKAFEPYTLNLQVFTDLMKKPMENFWNSLSAAQRQQENLRGYTSFDLLWNDVTGYNPSADAGISGNMAFATTCAARYLTRKNPDLNKKTSFDSSPFVVLAGLLPLDFYYSSTNPKEPYNFRSFNSSKTASHVVQPNGSTLFSVLEGMPHNNVHNYIGGVGPLDPGPYGNMTNFLSPVDPIFFLHHSNMDRLWDVWTNKQKAIGKPFVPDKADFATYMNEPFLFYVDGSGKYVGPSKAGDYFSTDRFDYDYQPGFPTNLLKTAPKGKPAAVSLSATVKSGVASLTVPHAAVAAHMAKASSQTLFASVEMPRPGELSTTREYDVIVNAPPGVTKVDADSPYYAGTIAFFGCGMPSMRMKGTNATFAVPLPQTLGAFTALRAGQDAALSIRLATPSGKGTAPGPVAVSVGTI